jgi:hypothetical protein
MLLLPRLLLLSGDSYSSCINAKAVVKRRRYRVEGQGRFNPFLFPSGSRTAAATPSVRFHHVLELKHQRTTGKNVYGL